MLMRRTRIGAFLIAVAVVVSATTLLSAHGTAQSLRDLLPFGRTHRIAKLLQTVVNISTHKLATNPADSSGTGEKRRVEFFGSGFIVDPSGLIVTNRHVVDEALDITVILSDGTALPAKLRGTGHTIDIALLEVTPPKPLPTITWGDSDKVVVPAYAHAFKKGIAGSELVVIPEAGHLVNLEKPDQTAAALQRLAG